MTALHPQLQDIPWESSLCFTGHRPEKLPQGSALAGLREALYYYIRHAVSLGFSTYLTGMADGIDFIAADYLFRLRQEIGGIRIIGVQPCTNYEQFFRCCGYSIPHLRLMQEIVDRLVILPGSFRDKRVFLRRNQLMVDHTSGVIAVCQDGRSGSMQTLRYAQCLGRCYCRILPTPPPGPIPSPEDWPIEHVGFLP